jgi:alkylation response protein AidB-like acyl-CoA dehydrogenase
MFEWSETHISIRDAIRKFCKAEVEPKLHAIEHEGEPPYEVLRKLVATFGIADMARARFASQIERQRAREASGEAEKPRESREGKANPEPALEVAMQMIPIMELSRYSPGMVTALGVSIGLTARAVMAKGTIAQKERWALPLLTLEKIGAWAITEPGSGSDAFGAMKSTAKRDGEGGGYILNGSKTFITNGPYADTIVFICKLDEGNEPKLRKVLTFVLDRGTKGLVQSKPLRKLGLHGSPTGELFLEDVRVGKEHLLGETEEAPSRSGAKETFTAERTAVAAMALGIVEECQRLAVDYAKTRVQFGRPIGEFQLIQLKLAKMEVARTNIQNLVFRQIEMAGAGKTMSLAEASACKLYSAQAAMEVCNETVQLFGGNGYMSEYRVEQLFRDARVLQIYGGTDEIQVSQIARSLLGEA